MKRLTGAAHQTSDDLIVVNIATFIMLYFEEQLFTEVCSAKHAYNLLKVEGKFGELSRWKHEIKDVVSKKLTSNLLNTEDQ